MPPPGDFSKFSEKFNFFENWSKSALGSILGPFGVEIRILHEKLYRDVNSNQYLVSFLKTWFFINPVFGYFLTYFWEGPAAGADPPEPSKPEGSEGTWGEG